ncbi:uncharacterized protein LOC110975275 [Acanthaster planci]|uniref:Uncharacterized protein LOC110975275 n=1 Tax=Acanthaster planci TaxID=133434 RepID=A0A8B7XR37_ACAPL|nr:uncharacterized protein LOC110975275 [Acanthaster planci]
MAGLHVLFFTVGVSYLLAQEIAPANITAPTEVPLSPTDAPRPRSFTGTGGADFAIEDQAPTASREIEADHVTRLDLGGTNVGICTQRHLCRSLGCRFQTFNSTVGTLAGAMCQCDPACTFFNDCCVDYTEHCHPPSANYTPNAGLVRNNFTCYVEDPRTDIKKGYYVIGACPLDQTTQDSKIRQRCENVNENDFLSRVLVSGRKNDFPYSNVHCALCWGEKTSDLEAWSVAVSCESESADASVTQLFSNSTAKNTLDLVEQVQGCRVTIRQPQIAGVSLRACFLGEGGTYIDQCPPGSLLDVACKSYTAVSVASPLMKYTVGKNPHCLVCNNPSLLNTDCDEYYPFVYSVLFGGQTPPYGPSPVPPPLSIIFDFRSGGNVKVVTQDVVISEQHVTCPANEVYDPFLSACRVLSCGKGYVFDGDQCVRESNRLRPTSEQDIVVYVHITACNLTVSGSGLAQDVEFKMCLGDLIGVNQSDIQQSTMSPAVTDVNCNSTKQPTVHPLMVLTDWESFLTFSLKLEKIDDETLCPGATILSIEVIYHSVNLTLSRCNGRWIDETCLYRNQLHWAYSNTTYAIGGRIQRQVYESLAVTAGFRRCYSIQICDNPDLSCLLETFNGSLFHQSAENATSLVYIPTGDVFDREQYIETADGEIQVCSFNQPNGTRNRTQFFTLFEYSPVQQILSIVGNSISMLAAVITFVTFAVFKELRNRTSSPIMNFTISLFLAQLIFQLIGVGTGHEAICTAIAVLAHYFFLVSVMWTGVLAFILHRAFAKTRQSAVEQGHRRDGVLLPAAFAWGVPLAITLSCLILHLCDCTDLPLQYGNSQICWIGNGYVNIVVFGVPIGIVILANVILFSFTVRGIWQTKRVTKAVQSKSEIQQVKEELVIYIKISSLMGFTWITGFAAAISDVPALWYVFILLNSCQGLLVCISFVCNRRVWCLWRDGLGKMCARARGLDAGESDTGTLVTGVSSKAVQLSIIKTKQ